MSGLYDNPAQMEPLIIDSSRPVYHALIGLAHELSEASACLDAALPTITAKSLSELVSGMNCYYSNLIEGHHTLPVDIEKALFEVREKLEQQELQSLAMAHIEADRWAKSQSLELCSLQSFLLEVHRRFCEQLPKEMMKLKDGSDMEPGKFRGRDVQVGIHVAPCADTLGLFMARFEMVYSRYLKSSKRGGISKLDGILATFAAHHRMVWIHPFLDGNGRVARIAIDAMLRACGVNGASLWSMSRGFAKTAEEYKAKLAGADQPRMGDLDGRGNLSEKRLAEFCEYAMQTAIDQAKFMTRMFALDNFRFRAEHFFQKVRFDLKPESAHLFIHAFSHGEFERMEASRLTGLPERTARNVLNALVVEGFLVSDTPRGKLRVGFPMHALGSLLPNLYPAGDLDVDPQALKLLISTSKANNAARKTARR
ncbi:MAG: Fic family protein [Nitrosomonadales bacterium]